MTMFAGRALRRVVRLCSRYPRLTLALGLVLAALGVYTTSTHLTFETSELHLLPEGPPYVTRYREYSRDFGELDEIVIVVRGRTFMDRNAFAARLVHELRAGPIRFNHLAYRVALGDVDHVEAGRALLYLPVPTLEQLRDRIFDHQELIESMVAAPGLVSLLEGMNQEFASMFVSHFFDLGLRDGATATDLRFLATLVSQLREEIRHPAPYRSPWGTMLSLGDVDEDAGYFVSDAPTRSAGVAASRTIAPPSTRSAGASRSWAPSFQASTRA
ncbi:MAG: hypothetical protein DMD81_23975 [Candidatus Rokuibacteriota bacterium]|nr:MAG: hypothetical protein DMD81_23975 [Candidatus Rokubacteria bacterium]